MPRKKLVEPFSVFKPSRYNRWVIKLDGKQYSTGLQATAENREIAVQKGWAIYYEWVRRGELHKTQYIEKKITFPRAVSDFTDNYLRNKAPKTKELYKRTFALFTDNRQMNEYTILHLLKYAIFRNKNIKNGWDNYRRAYNTFLAWCVKNKYLAETVEINQYFPKPIPKKVQVFTIDEYMALYNYFVKKDKEFAVLLQLLVSTGLRIHEALELRRTDIIGNTIHILSKDGKRAETVTISDSLLQTLEALPKWKHGRVFSWQLSAVSRLRKRLNAAMEQNGIPRNGRSFHELRKTFISIMANNGVDVRTAAILARCDIKVMMKHYTVMSTETVQNAVSLIESKIHTDTHTITP